MSFDPWGGTPYADDQADANEWYDNVYVPKLRLRYASRLVSQHAVDPETAAIMAALMTAEALDTWWEETAPPDDNV